MSSSPCCAAYKFPAKSPSEAYDYLAAAAAEKAQTAEDYFALRRPAAPPQKPMLLSPAKPARRHGSGSVSSLASEATIAEHLAPAGHDFSRLTDTLFEDCESAPGSEKTPRNVLLLTLDTPHARHHKARSSLGLVAGVRVRVPREASDGAGTSSAVEPRFSLDRKYSLGVAEMVLGTHGPATAGPASVLDSIRALQTRRTLLAPPPESFREPITRLSPTITYLSPAEIAQMLAGSAVHAYTGLRDVVVLDIRPLADHVKAHVAGAINICLPLTLLKRPSFDFRRCVGSLPAYERCVLQSYFRENGARGPPAIVLYDHHGSSSNMYHMCRKLVDQSCFDAAAPPRICLVDSLFQALASAHPDLLASGKPEPIDVSRLSVQDPPDVPATAPPQTAAAAASGTCTPFPVTTPNVSNFSLPCNLPETKFKIRHNEERFDFSTAPSAEDQLSRVAVDSPALACLPQWLRDLVSNTTQLRADFNRLEECEKSRLNSALKMRSESEFLTPGGRTEATPVVNSGLDYGHKNRYKDIFLYEHSRVSLHDALITRPRAQGTDGAPLQLGCGYINASYLRASETVLGAIVGAPAVNDRLLRLSNYIATQGPLLRTAGDFWRCVVNQRALVVVSLTNDVENGVEKCFAFWTPGTYSSGQNAVDVRLVRCELFGALKLRTFDVAIDGGDPHRVMQLHLDSWVDMGVAVDSGDVLAMIHLKNHILASTRDLPEYPSVIHCLAGCGRTGVFAAADMLVNAFDRRGNNYDVTADPVYDVVNDLRRQRILMVQTIRQYGAIYRLLIHRITGLEKWRSISETKIATSFFDA